MSSPAWLGTLCARIPASGEIIVRSQSRFWRIFEMRETSLRYTRIIPILEMKTNNTRHTFDSVSLCSHPVAISRIFASSLEILWRYSSARNSGHACNSRPSSKSDNDHIAPISWRSRHKIKEWLWEKSRTELAYNRILITPRYNLGKVWNSSAMVKWRTRHIPETKERTTIYKRAIHLKSYLTSCCLVLAIIDESNKVKTSDGIGGQSDR
jgi:hypothetical protein